MRYSNLLAPLFLLSATTVVAYPQGAPSPPAPAPAPTPSAAATESGTASEISTAIGAVGDLLSGESLEHLTNIVNNAVALMTPQFINDTEILMTTVTHALPGVITLAKPILSIVGPVLSFVEPFLGEGNTAPAVAAAPAPAPAPAMPAPAPGSMPGPAPGSK